MTTKLTELFGLLRSLKPIKLSLIIKPNESKIIYRYDDEFRYMIYLENDSLYVCIYLKKHEYKTRIVDTFKNVTRCFKYIEKELMCHKCELLGCEPSSLEEATKK